MQDLDGGKKFKVLENQDKLSSIAEELLEDDDNHDDDKCKDSAGRSGSFFF